MEVKSMLKGAQKHSSAPSGGSTLAGCPAQPWHQVHRGDIKALQPSAM
jgi:hypothetical protein